MIAVKVGLVYDLRAGDEPPDLDGRLAAGRSIVGANVVVDSQGTGES